MSNPDHKKIPWAKFLNAQLHQVTPSSLALMLDPKPEQTNHLGFVNAPMQWGVAEAAAVGLCIQALGDKMWNYYIVAKSAQLNYLKAAKGKVYATASFVDDLTSEDIPKLLENEDRLDLEIDVPITNGDGLLMTECRAVVAVRPARQ